MTTQEAFTPTVEGESGRGHHIAVRYVNYRGEVAVRWIVPIRVLFGATEWHPEPQWLLEAYDAGKDANRMFALRDCDFAPDRAALNALREHGKEMG